MKKNLLLALVILLPLLGMAFTGPVAPQATLSTTNIDARNKTGANVALKLMRTGDTTNLTIPTGVSTFSVTSATYDYYASTICGNIAGQVNLSSGKAIIFSCEDGQAKLDVVVPPTPCGTFTEFGVGILPVQNNPCASFQNFFCCAPF